MATPFVAGIVALGLEAAPSATPAQLKTALQASAQDAGVAGPDNEWGHGLVDARAFVAALGAAPAGTAPWPAHTLVQGTVASGASRDFPLAVTASGSPLGVTLRTANGASTCLLPIGGSCLYGYEWAPDLDAYLVSPSGTAVAMSRCMLEATNGNCAAPGRFETLGVAAAAAGTWTLRVESFSGSGSFVADAFGALGAVAPPSPPAAPTGLSATATSSASVTVGWTDASSDETGFEVQRCTGADCSGFATVATTAAGTTSYVDGSRTASTTYGYRVRSVNGNGASAWVGPVYATTLAAPVPPNAPTGLGASATSSTSVTVGWTDASSDETGFELQRCTGSGCATFAAVATLAAGTTSFVDGSRTASTTYGYRVRSVNANGASAWTGPVYATTPAAATVPSAPTGLTATAVSATRVDLRWTDTSGNETGFRLERCSGAKCTGFAVVATLAPGATTYTDTSGLQASTSYRYRVQAFNATGFSAYSAVATVKTLRR